MTTINSNGTGGGDWHVGASWNGGSVPAATDRVVILAGDTIEIDGDTTIGDTPALANEFVIDVAGTLKWKDNPGGSWTLTVRGSTRIQENAVLTIGTDANPIPANRLATVSILGHNPNYRFPNFATVTTTGAAAPVLRTRGAVDYHMASTAMHRARLVSAISAGDDVAVEIDRAVDWEVGDVVFLGRGGSQTTQILDGSGQLLSTYDNDRTTISGKTDSTHYTLAHLDSNHVDGDIIAHGTRNVIIESDETYGWSMWKDPGSDADALHGTLDLSWTCLKNIGGISGLYGNGIYIYGNNNTSLEVKSGDYQIKNCVFDGTGGASGVQISIVGCRNCRVLTKDFDNIVMYPNGKNGIVLGNTASGWEMGGVWTMGNVTVIGGRDWCISCQDLLLKADSLWLTFAGQATANTQAALRMLQDATAVGVECGDLRAYGGWHAVSIPVAENYYSPAAELLRVASGELYNARYCLIGATSNRTAIGARRAVLRGMKFAHSGQQGMYLGWCAGGVEFHNCEFDNLNTTGVATQGALELQNDESAFGPFFVLIKNCRFGLNARNVNRNITLFTETGWVTRTGFGRLRIEDSEFKEPIWDDAEPSWGEWGKWRGIIVSGSTYCELCDVQMNRAFTLELVRPKSYDASDVDQWPLTYAGVDHMAFFGGGGEMRNESSVVIDGSFGMKFTPWSPYAANAGSSNVPYKIPVQSGQLLTVKLSLRKTISQSVEKKRPRLRLLGCGIIDEEAMPDTNDTWEEVTVSGTTDKAGMVYFWVEPGYGFYDGMDVHDRWYQTVYADKLVVTAV